MGCQRGRRPIHVEETAADKSAGPAGCGARGARAAFGVSRSGLARAVGRADGRVARRLHHGTRNTESGPRPRSEEHTSELQSHHDIVCRLLLEKKKKTDKWPLPSP